MAGKTEVAILIGAFVIIFGFFSVSIIMYATGSPDTTKSVVLKKFEEMINVTESECSQQPITNNTVDEYSYSESCSKYEGICSSHLQATNSNLAVIVNSTITDQQLSSFFYDLEGHALFSKECLFTIIPFLCQYLYPPCDVNGNVKFITQQQCLNIRDEVCASEWRYVMAAKIRSILPICEAIDDKRKEVNISESLICHYQFKEYCGLCLPLCATFSQYSDQVRITEDIIIVTSSVLAIIGGIVVFIFAAIRKKTMLTFPQVLAIYTTANVMFFGFFTHVSVVCATVTWFLHLFHLFLVISFPFWSRFLSEQKWKTRLHIVEVVGSVVICSVAPIIVATMSGYTISRFPPLFVRPPRNVTFYSLILPTTVLIAVGLSLTISSFITIHKIKKRGKGCLAFFSVPEVKILTVLSYYIVFGFMQLINITITVNEASPFRDDLCKYFECQLTGYNPACEDIRRQLEKHLKPGLTALCYILFAFVTWVNLLFAIHREDIKSLMQKLTSCYFIVKTSIYEAAVGSSSS